MRIYPQLLVDQEFKSLGDQGFMGTLNDRQFAFLRSKGYVNALPDMMTSWLSYSPANLFSLNEPGIWLDPSDLTTMFQDRAGSTAVTTPGQSVGLRLDKSKGLVLGSELLSTGFTGLVGTATAATYNTTTGVGTVTRVDGSNRSFVRFTTDATRFYSVSIQNTGGGSLSVDSAAGATTITTGSSLSFISGPLASISIFASTNATTVSFTVASVKELPGNHAVANSDAARGIYGIEPLGGRRNLLVYTEEFNNAAGWATSEFAGTASQAVVTSNAALSPVGDMTADRIVFNLNGGTTITDRSFIIQSFSFSAVAYTFSVWLRTESGTAQVLVETDSANANLATVTTEWQRFNISRVATAGSRQNRIGLRGTTGSSNSATVLAWGAQLETGSTATAYQRVTTQYDVTEAGKQTLHYVQYDGSDDGYVTPTITPGTDKVQFFAGVRKLSDATFGVIAEHSPSLAANNGGFYLLAPNSNATATYGYGSKGTTFAGGSVSGFAAPITNVLAMTADISQPVTTLRINGTQASQRTTTQGTGNFLAYPLYIGRRGGATLPFNGRDYGIVVRFGANLDASTIAATESWLNQKTGAF